jgi:signal transduction histidine kinase
VTKRIALAILLTTWAVLIAGCLVAYFTVRWAMIRQLDHSMALRAAAIPELAAPPSTKPSPTAGPTLSHDADRYIIRTSDQQLKVSPPGGGRSLSDLTPVSATFDKTADDSRWRVLTLRGTARPAPGDPAAPVPVPVTVTYYSSADPLDRLLTRLAVTFTVFGACAGLITALVALRVSRTALRPLHDTAAVIAAIEPRHLDRRLDLVRLPPELIPMANRLNEMLERIDRAYAQRQQFLADASHELRTPVAALVTTAEVALRHSRDADAYRKTVETCLTDARLLRRLVERLMEQCRAETLSHDEPPAHVDLTPLLSECADHAAALGQTRGITLIRSLPAELSVQTQPGRLRSVMTNLLANAVEHNRPGGTVELTASPNGHMIHLTVKDTGPGIPAEHLPHLFEPFYRIDKTRSHDADPGQAHMGLGLALVQSHLQALGGRVKVESTPGAGTIFHVEIPRASAAPEHP